MKIFKIFTILFLSVSHLLNASTIKFQQSNEYKGSIDSFVSNKAPQVNFGDKDQLNIQLCG